MTSGELSFLASTAFLVFLVWGVAVPYAFRLRKKHDAALPKSPLTVPISADLGSQKIVITITLQAAGEPPRAG